MEPFLEVSIFFTTGIQCPWWVANVQWAMRNVHSVEIKITSQARRNIILIYNLTVEIINVFLSPLA